MALRYRITLLIIVLLAVAVLGNTALLVLLGERAIVQRAESDGLAIARLLANGVGVAERLPDVVNAQIGRQMVAEAALAAQLIDLAGERGLSAVELNARLEQVVARTGIGRIVALGHDGAISADASHSFDPPLPGDADAPLAAVFAHTASGKRWSQTLPPVKLPGELHPMRFAAVRAAHGDGIVVVGEGVEETAALRRQIGPERNIAAMVGDAGIEGIWIFGENRQLVASASVNADAAAALTPEETASINSVIQTGAPISSIDGDLIRVVAPVLDDDRLAIGAALIRFSTAEVHASVRRTLLLSVALALVLLLAGAVLANLLGRRISRPIVAIADAARAVHSHAYDPAMLAGIGGRNDEIGSLARDFADMARQVLTREEELDRLVSERTQQLEERNQELTRAIDVIQADLDAARSLQHAILPQKFPPGRSFAGVAIMTAARHVGGDFYDFFMVDDDHLAIVIADVSGKGVPAALFMAVSRTILRAQAMATPQPQECVRRANDQICTQNPMSLFITVFYGLLNVRTGAFRYVNAGHPSPVWLQREARRTAPLPWTEGVALGVMDGLDYREGSVALRPGDTLVLYTDGVSEAMDEDANEFTDARILATLADEWDSDVAAILGRLIHNVEEFVDSAPQSDDLTCIVLRFLGEAAALPAAEAAATA
ncbi:MAG TPA: SpoIIE family protein phosphatase [Stellaceae bacterium]|nr:SpoIIE family protein phosphatase [Stellaceae bacterium]